MIAEEGPDDLVCDVLLGEPGDVSSSDDESDVDAVSNSGQLSLGRKSEHVSFLPHIGIPSWNSPVLFGSTESILKRASRFAMMQNTRALSNGSVGRKLLKRNLFGDGADSSEILSRPFRPFLDFLLFFFVFSLRESSLGK